MGLDPSHQDRCEQDRADACPPCRTASARARSASLTQKVREKTGVDDWKFESYGSADGKVTFTREEFMVEVLEVEYTGGGTAKRVSGLPANTRPSAGDRLAAVYEEANPGLVMIRFDPHLCGASSWPNCHPTSSA